MFKSKSLKIYIRSGVDSFLSAHLKLLGSSLKLDKFLWILSKIDYITDKDPYVFKDLPMVPISSVILRHEIGERYKEYLDILLSLKIIDTDNFYVTPNNGGKYSKCKCYGFTSKFNKRSLVPYYINNKALIKKKDAWLAKQRKNIIKEESTNSLYNKLKNVSIDIKSAEHYLRNKLSNGEISEREFHLEWLKCNRINDKDFYITKDDYGRIHTNLTSISKYIRDNFIKINDQDITGIDIKSSQPAILYSILTEFYNKTINNFDDEFTFIDPRKKYISKFNQSHNKIHFLDGILIDSPEIDNVISMDVYLNLLHRDIHQYKFLLNSGIYESFANGWEAQFGEKITIDQSKKLWYQFAFGRIHTPKYKKCRRVWKSLMPIVVDLIERIKKTNHKVMAHLLQRRESHIVIDNLCKDFDLNVDENYFTVHDCIYFIKENSIFTKAKECFTNILEKFNVPTIVCAT
jgi:hypothetical protein